MDTRLLKHFEAELGYLREMGAEFAQSYPKIAARLGMDGTEVLDPYVERILEGSAFLAARVQLELEMQYPAFTSGLLEIVYPHYLAPTPSMMIAQLQPDYEGAALIDGFLVPRHAQLRSTLAEGTQSACLFRTAQDLTLWPVEISEAEYIDGRGELVAAGVAGSTIARAGLRLRLTRPGGKPIGEIALDNLTIFLGGQGPTGWKLHETLCTDVVGVVARSTDRRADWTAGVSGVVPRGLEPDEALLPVVSRTFDGYRLLQEYFALPERFHFVELQGLAPAVSRASGSDLDVYILLGNGRQDLVSSVSPDLFSLHCVPAINLFEKRCDRVPIATSDAEQHVVADRTAQLEFEIYRVNTVRGISSSGGNDVEFNPFFSVDESSVGGGQAPAFFLQSRRMRQRTEKERLKGARTNYLGSETYLSLVDSEQAPYSEDLAQLAVQALVTNRDLPMLLASGGADVFHLPDGGPVASVRTPVPPTRPRPTLAQGEAAWRLISHLSLNYLSLTDSDDGGGAEALRELIGLYAPSGNRAVEKQVEGLINVSSRPIVRRMSDEVLTTAVRGLEVRVEFDDALFEGTSPYQLGAVLERFFRKYTTINSFTETVLATQQRGEIARWRGEQGVGRLI